MVGSGAAMFARYAFPPNELGHCGPPGADLLLAGGSGGAAGSLDGEVRRRAPHFDGAWPYLRLLASGAGVADPLDGGVVSAYWLGGELLDRVGPGDLLTTALDRFGRQPGVADRLAEAPGLAAAGAGHAFHVFVVYPWVGLLGGGSDVPRSILDSCRVRWGTVRSVAGESAEISSRPLTWDAGGLRLGPPRLQTCRWARDRHEFVPGLRPGNEVSLHWDWVCDRLTAGQVADLADRTDRQLDAVNAWLARRPVPAPAPAR